MRAFRALADADFELPAAGVVLVGPNGHGKTSLLEALLYLEVFRSFRGARDRELVRFGEDGFRVEVETDGGRQSGGSSPPGTTRGPEKSGWSRTACRPRGSPTRSERCGAWS